MTKTLPKWRSLPKLPVAKLDQIELKHGAHKARDNGLCVMEAVAWVAGEPHSDHPACASVVISTLLRNWNDALPTDADRERLLRPIVPLLVNTAGDAATELKRSWMAFDWLVRELLPAFLDLAKIDTAKKLRALKPFTSKVELDAGVPVIHEAQSKAAAAWAAARDAAWDAARDAAWSAARDAAWSAAGAAAWAAAWAAAGDAAVAAARDAAWAAARAAAWDAARKRLAPTVKKLQKSAVALVKRMIAVKA